MLRPLKVLVVDDDPAYLVVVTAWLERGGCQVITRSSPFGTSVVILKEQPDVVILDVEMPALSGEVLADLINRKTNKNVIRVIFCSGKSPQLLSALAKLHNALGYIEKTDSAVQFMNQFYALTAPLRDKRM